MPVIPFPAQVMTLEDEAAIVARASRVGYRCRLTLDEAGHRAVVLVNSRDEVRGRVTKAHGVFTVTDARGHPIASSRSRDEVLATLEP